jgi:hypothetical protein
MKLRKGAPEPEPAPPASDPKLEAALERLAAAHAASSRSEEGAS